jgi:hypothetical protein
LAITSDRSRALRMLTAPRVLGLVLLLGACGLPTDLPYWDTRWIIPGAETSIGVGTMLPVGISPTADRTAFQLSIGPVGIAPSLAEMCPPCAALDGLLLPKPAFSGSFSSQTALPAGVLSAELASGQIQLRLSHDFAFDPLRPSAVTRGFIIVTARSGETVLARDSISGFATALPPGATLTRTIPLAPGTIAGVVTVTLQVGSPVGDPVVLNAEQRLSLSATLVQLRVGEARVRLTNRSVTTPETDLDLQGIDEAVSERLQGGAIEVRMENPFEVSGTLNLWITAAGVSIVRPVAVQRGATTVRVELTAAELRSLVGRPGVRIRVAGGVSTPAAGTNVRAADAISIRTRLDLTIGRTEGAS